MATSTNSKLSSSQSTLPPKMGIYNELIVSAKQFMRIAESPGVNIRSAHFIPPRLGRPGDFGMFKVKYVR